MLYANICLVSVIPRGVIVDAEKQAQLDALLANIQQRWGADVILQGYTSRQRPKISTGFAALDVALDGGIPTGQATELLGKLTSGMTTLGYKIIASAQSASASGIYIDLDSTFDPDYAQRCGIALDRLFLARAETDTQALDIARDLIQSGSIAVIALDMGQLQPNESQLRRLTSVLSRSGCVVLLMLTLPAIVSPQVYLNGSPTAMRLLVERRAWLKRQSDIRGYCVAVSVLRHPQAFGKHIDMVIDFDDNVAGEPL